MLTVGWYFRSKREGHLSTVLSLCARICGNVSRRYLFAPAVTGSFTAVFGAGIDIFAPVKIAAVEGDYQRLRRCDIRGNGNVVKIAHAKQFLLALVQH